MRQYKLAPNVRTRVNTWLRLGGKVVDYHETASVAIITVELQLPSGTFEQRCTTYLDSLTYTHKYSGSCYRPTFTTKEGVVIHTDWTNLSPKLKDSAVAIREALDNPVRMGV